MKVLFVFSLFDAQSLKSPLESLEQIQMGISYISSFLKKHEHSTRLLVLSSDNEKGSLALASEAIKEFDPGIIAFTSVFTQHAFLAKIAKHIKNDWPDKFLLIGGPHPSLNPEEIIEEAFDAVCVGEGEEPTLELAEQLEKGLTPKSIPNLWIKNNDGSISKNDTRPFMQDLDKLPSPDRDMWKPWINERSDARLSVLLGRGCPFQCTYCSNHGLAKLASGQYVRFRSPDNILEEIRALKSQYPERDCIYLEVETITIKKEWLFELCEKLAEFNTTLKQPISYSCNMRIGEQTSDNRIFELMKKANFISINIGLESGSERVRKEILNRNYSNEDLLQTVSLAKEHGLKINIYNLVGIPDETIDDHMDTVKMNQIIQPDWTLNSIFFPYPGTKLHNYCKEKGYIRNSPNIAMERRQAIMDLPGFSRKQIQHAYTWFEYRIYKGHKPLYILIIRILTAKIRSLALTNYLYRKLTLIPFVGKLRSIFGKKS